MVKAAPLPAKVEAAMLPVDVIFPEVDIVMSEVSFVPAMVASAILEAPIEPSMISAVPTELSAILDWVIAFEPIVVTPVLVTAISPVRDADCHDPAASVPIRSAPAAVGSGTVPDIVSQARVPLPLSLRKELADPSDAGQVYVGLPSFVTPLVISSVGALEYPSAVIAPVITTGLAGPAPPVWTARTGEETNSMIGRIANSLLIISPLLISTRIWSFYVFGTFKTQVYYIMHLMVVNTHRAERFHIVSLGCPKNLTDAEVLMGHMRKTGYEYTDDPASADVIIVNTCAFLSSARKESLDVIKEMAAHKKNGLCRQLLVAGCLPKYVKACGRTPLQLQGVDGVVDSIGLHDCHVPRIKATPPWTAYVKISEGCNNNCAYCLIPSIRGRLRNRKTSDVLREVAALAGRGVKEIIFVAQDTTAHPKFPEILKKTAKIKGVRWIRIMYTHPKHITDKFIDVMAKERKILKYIDLPMQHSSDKMLKAMNRGYDREYLAAIIAKLRKKMSSVAIRTTFIVGFPGETEEDFRDLCDFVEKMKFDRVGVFPFSREKGTKAYGMKGQVAVDVARERHLQLMEIQAKISRRKNKEFVGKTMDVLIEGSRQTANGTALRAYSTGRQVGPTANGSQPQDVIRHSSSVIHYFGRTYRDAPEIDGVINVIDRGGFKTRPYNGRRPHKVCPGDIVKVRITRAGTHDLVGEIV